MGASSGSRASTEPVSRLGPSGFDPERVRLRSSRELIRGVAQRWTKQYSARDVVSAWGQRRTYGQISDALYALDPETASVADVNAAMSNTGWVTENCDLCDAECEHWLEVGQEPDYEARWLYLCLPCAEHLAAIAMETRRAETKGSVAKP